MTLATRIRHQVNMHADWERDEARLAAHYSVQGTDKVLVVTAWLSHETAEDPAAVEATLEWMDQMAEEDAQHPETVPTAQWTFT